MDIEKIISIRKQNHKNFIWWKSAHYVPGKTEVPVPLAKGHDYIGGTFYHGPMSRWKSVSEYREKAEPPVEIWRTDKEERKKYKKKRKKSKKKKKKKAAFEDLHKKPEVEKLDAKELASKMSYEEKLMSPAYIQKEIGGFPGEPHWEAISIMKKIIKDPLDVYPEKKRKIKEALQRFNIYQIVFIDDERLAYVYPTFNKRREKIGLGRPEGPTEDPHALLRKVERKKKKSKRRKKKTKVRADLERDQTFVMARIIRKAISKWL